MRKLMILVFGVIGIAVSAQNDADGQHAYISAKKAAEFIKADDYLCAYQLTNDSLYVRIFHEFIQWPLGDYPNLEGLLTRFENPVVKPYYSKRYETDENFYQITTPKSNVIVSFGQQYDEPEIHTFVVIAKIMGDVKLNCNIKVGTTIEELFETLNIPKPHYYTKLTRLTVDLCAVYNRVVFYFDNRQISRIDIFIEDDREYGSWENYLKYHQYN